MADSALYLQTLSLSPVMLSGPPLLKLYLGFSQPDLSFAAGQFSYTDPTGQELTLPLLSLNEGILLAQLESEHPYSGTLEVHFTTGEVLTQKLGFALMPWLENMQISYQALTRSHGFKGYVALKAATEVMQQINHFQLQCPLVHQGEAASLAPNSGTTAYFHGLAPEQC